jgi:hypothetical protein
VIAADLPREVEAEPLSALAATLDELELRGPQLRRGTFPMAQFASVSGKPHFSKHSRGFHRAARRAAGGQRCGPHCARGGRHGLSRLGEIVRRSSREPHATIRQPRFIRKNC